MTDISMADYCRTRDVPDSTISNAIKYGLIQKLPNGKLNAEEVDATWLADHRARQEAIKLTSEHRERALGAAVVDMTASMSALQRDLAGLEQKTSDRDAAEQARHRRELRLHAALDAMPSLCTRETSEALGRSPAAVRAVLLEFARRIAEELR